MSRQGDPLRDGLAQIADGVTAVDLYERSVRTSRRIGRRRAGFAGAAVLMLLALAGGGLWRMCGPGGCPGPVPPSPQALAPAGPHRSVPGLPGTLFYLTSDEQRLVRLDSGVVRVVAEGADFSRADISADGRRVAYIDGDGVKVVEDGRERWIRRTGVLDQWAPAWTPDGKGVLVALRGDPDRVAVLDVASGESALAPTAASGTHGRFSGDGRTVVVVTPACGLLLTSATGTGVRAVPVLGDDDRSRNPTGAYACELAGVSADGARAAVALGTGGDPGRGSGSGAAVDTVVDTSTGQTVPLPGTGNIVGLRYHVGGDLLIRAERDGRTILTLLSPTDTILAEVVEPAAVRHMRLIGYTR